jgi:hypothetical protein
MKRNETKVVTERLVRLSWDDWSEVGDLIEQCIYAADIDESYARHVRDKAMAMMRRIQNDAVDNGLRKKAKEKLKFASEPLPPTTCSLCGGDGKYVEHIGPMQQVHYCRCEEGQRKRKLDSRLGKLECRCRFCDMKPSTLSDKSMAGE